jgi:hypothetical protein
MPINIICNEARRVRIATMLTEHPLRVPTGCHVATDKAKANHPFAVEGWLWLKYRDEFRSPEDQHMSSDLSHQVSPN